jgi:hypothetical protein
MAKVCRRVQPVGNNLRLGMALLALRIDSGHISSGEFPAGAVRRIRGESERARAASQGKRIKDGSPSFAAKSPFYEEAGRQACARPKEIADLFGGGDANKTRKRKIRT